VEGARARDPDPVELPQERQASGLATKQASKRGSRLPPDWYPSALDLAFARKEGFFARQTEREAEKFADYWHARAGPNGVKLDWSATWRNWLRKQKDAPNGHPAKQNLTELAFDMADEIRARKAAGELPLDY
jgi:hypothetical protein